MLIEELEKVGHNNLASVFSSFSRKRQIRLDTTTGYDYRRLPFFFFFFLLKKEKEGGQNEFPVFSFFFLKKMKNGAYYKSPVFFLIFLEEN